MDFSNDERIILTLDAGGTNLVYSAFKGGIEIINPITYSTETTDKEKSLKIIIEGFKEVKSCLKKAPAAISVAFPGPADYSAGIITNIGNIPALSGGIPLKAMLENYFQIPVFINNDGNLFAYGEAIAGLLPRINRNLAKKDIYKQYKNLLGVTIGTGFGAGLVINNTLVLGDNGNSAEIWNTRNYKEPDFIAEEGISKRAIQRYYSCYTKDEFKKSFTPFEIYQIAKGKKHGDKVAAIKAFEKMGIVLGEALANAITIIDGAIVIGGGISGAADLFFPKMLEHMNGTIKKEGDVHIPRLSSHIYNLEDSKSANAFYSFKSIEIAIPSSEKKISYAPERKLPVGISHLGTNKATALGAYMLALKNI